MSNHLIQYIIVGIILLFVAIYIFRQLIRMLKKQGGSSCDHCGMNQSCGSKEQHKS